MPSLVIFKSKKYTLPSGKSSKIDFKFLSKLLNLSNMNWISLGRIRSKVSSTYLLWNFMTPALPSSVTIIF